MHIAMYYFIRQIFLYKLFQNDKITKQLECTQYMHFKFDLKLYDILGKDGGLQCSFFGPQYFHSWCHFSISLGYTYYQKTFGASI